MKLRLADEESPPQIICPDHGCLMVFEDGDEYGSVFVCQEQTCTRTKYDGLSRSEMDLLENGPGYSGRAPAWRA